MKKILISIVAVAFVAVMITSVYAAIPPPDFPCGRCPGFTPGFWKHNIHVRLGEKLDGKPFNGEYNAFEGGDLDGVKLTDLMMDGYLDAINVALGDGYTFQILLGYLYEPGWSADRTNTANWFNYVAGYGPFPVDD